MRSKLILVATVVAGLVLASTTAAADPVQEQLRLMEQRMADMEDRLQATSDELRSAKAVVDQQQGLLSDAGLVDASDEGIRSAVGNFLQQVEVSGVLAAGYNQRFTGPGDNNQRNVGLYRHPYANTFTFDQWWFTLDKTPTEADRAGFHVDLLGGKTAEVQFGSQDGINIYTGYVSYLAPIGSGVQLDVGKLPTPLGAEVVQTNKNYNITQGLVWALQPVTHTGVQLSGNITDEIGFTFGVVNDVFSDTSMDDSRDKAYYAQFAFGGDKFGVNVGGIIGKDSSSGYLNESGTVCDSGDECKTSVFNVVATANPSDNLSVWADFTWLKSFGDDIRDKGDVHGIAVAGRMGLTDNTGIAGRVEYVNADKNYMMGIGAMPEMSEVMSYTLTGDHALTDNLTFRIETRVDVNLTNNERFAIGSNETSGGGGSGVMGAGTRGYQVVGLAELFYQF